MRPLWIIAAATVNLLVVAPIWHLWAIFHYLARMPACRSLRLLGMACVGVAVSAAWLALYGLVVWGGVSLVRWIL